MTTLRETLENYGISEREKVEFFKNLSTLLRGGVAVNEAFHALAEGTSSRVFARVLSRMAHAVESGASVTTVFRAEGAVFDPICVSLIRVGEVSGTLNESLLFLSEYLERRDDLTQEVRSAMTYPKFILTTTLSVALFLTVFILPKLIPVFAALDVALPLPTRILLGVMGFAKAYGVALLTAIAVGVILFAVFRKRTLVRLVVDRILLSTPLFGRMIRDYQLALFSQLFLTLYRTGSPVNEALDVSATSAVNIHYERALGEARLLVEQGSLLSQALARHPELFPINLVVMVSTGEKSGALEESFSALSEYYSKEVNRKTKRLPSLIEPVLLIVIAVAVGFVALSIVMPIYEVTRGLSR